MIEICASDWEQLWMVCFHQKSVGIFPEKACNHWFCWFPTLGGGRSHHCIYIWYTCIHPAGCLEPDGTVRCHMWLYIYGDMALYCFQPPLSLHCPSLSTTGKVYFILNTAKNLFSQPSGPIWQLTTKWVDKIHWSVHGAVIDLLMFYLVCWLFQVILILVMQLMLLQLNPF